MLNFIRPRSAPRPESHTSYDELELEDLIIRFGLVAVFFGSALEGDVILLLTGVTAHLGLLNLPLALGVGAAGCFVGDTIWFTIGRRKSEAIRATRMYRGVGPTVERVANRLGPWQIVGARFIYGTRTATMLYWGIHRLSYARFVLVDAVGCVVWAGLLGALGYWASSGAAALLGEIKQIEVWLLGAALTGVLIVAGARLHSTRRHRQRQ